MLGFYQHARNKTSALKQAQKRKSKKVVITSVRPTAKSGIYWINTRLRK